MMPHRNESRAEAQRDLKAAHAAHVALCERFELVEHLGEGGHGTVYRARDRASGEGVAVKIVHGAVRSVRNEIAANMAGQHPNLVWLLEAFTIKKDGEDIYYLIQELCEGGDLLSELIREGYSEPDAARVMKGVVAGVDQLHRRGIAHCDLKLENIFLHSRTHPKIGDMGLATSFRKGTDGTGEGGLRSVAGSLLYIAPEVLACIDDKEASYDEKADIWSLGVALYILLSKEPPFESRENSTMIKKILSGDVVFGRAFDGVSSEAKDLIKRMLTVDPARRATLKEVEAHPWMAMSGAGHGRRGGLAWHGAMPDERIADALRSYRVHNNSWEDETDSWAPPGGGCGEGEDGQAEAREDGVRARAEGQDRECDSAAQEGEAPQAAPESCSYGDECSLPSCRWSEPAEAAASGTRQMRTRHAHYHGGRPGDSESSSSSSGDSAGASPKACKPPASAPAVPIEGRKKGLGLGLKFPGHGRVRTGATPPGLIKAGWGGEGRWGKGWGSRAQKGEWMSAGEEAVYGGDSEGNDLYDPTYRGALPAPFSRYLE